jgi:hypothetical protein
LPKKDEKSTAGGKYARICDLPGCNISFRTNHRHKRFCSTEHKTEYWRTLRGGHERTAAEISKLRNRVIDLEDRVTALEGERSKNGRGAHDKAAHMRE